MEDILARFDVKALRSAVIVGLVAYFASLIVALVLVMLAAAGVGMAGTGSPSGTAQPVLGGSVPSLWPAVFPLAVQLVSMGMLAMLHASMDVLGLVHGSVSIFAVPLLLTVVSLSALFFGSLAARRRNPVGAGKGVWAQAVITGIVFTVLVNTFSAIFGLAIPIPGVQGLSFSAVDFGSFVLVFVLAAATALAGWTHPWSHRWQSHPIAVLARRALLTAGVYLGLFSLITIPVSVVVLGIKFGWAAVMWAPLWAPSAALYLFGLGQLSSIGVTWTAGSLVPSSGPGSSSSYVSAPGLDQVGVPAWAGWLLVLLALVSVLAASILWYLRRGSVDRHSITGWLPLPLTFLATGIIVTWLSTVSGSTEISSTRGSAGIALASWTPLLMLLWGALAEASSRLGAPLALSILPARAVALLAGQRTAPAGTAAADTAPANVPTIPGAEVSPGIFPPASASPLSQRTTQADVPREQPEYPVIPPRKPLTPRTKRRVALIGGASAAVVVLIVAGFTTVNLIKGANGPDKVVQSYLQALQDGDAQKALAISDPNIPNERRVLLTNQVFGQARNRLDGFTVLGTDVKDNNATVHAELRQAGSKANVDYQLSKVAPDLLNDHWKLAPTPVGSFGIATDSSIGTITVNGVDVSLGAQPTSGFGSSYTFPAFPGTYTIGLPGSEKYLTTDGGTATVNIGNSQQNQIPGVVTLTTRPSDAFRTEVQAQVTKLLNQCAASTSLLPTGCPFGTYSFYPVRNIKWAITTMPTVLIGNGGNGQWSISSNQNGKATVSGEKNLGFGNSPDWQPNTQEYSFSFYGTATLHNDQISVTLN
ncbi:hypothetical protein [Arthrobacter bambusae]|uniref:hypothetical protein n=1 Tax=Arthrobacter bambusae TaxID=1338426 RepID=UPI00278A95C7|nr:hypothetical protein [Arthrobacter bambusae]MDQ0212563.1 hypothetical protein [Arthrobacter bambusae]MDQ0236945.1 hypothetical protein [Arthrobacter bambusae]